MLSLISAMQSYQLIPWLIACKWHHPLYLQVIWSLLAWQTDCQCNSPCFLPCSTLTSYPMTNSLWVIQPSFFCWSLITPNNNNAITNSKWMPLPIYSESQSHHNSSTGSEWHCLSAGNLITFPPMTNRLSVMLYFFSAKQFHLYTACEWDCPCFH